MKHLENFNHRYDKILNAFPFCLDDAIIKTVGIAWLFKENDRWVVIPKFTGPAQFYNAIFFIRIGVPFSLFFMVRWSTTARKQFLQAGIGWKQTGRFAVLCRFQTDASAAVGYHASLPNTGQASGWNYGIH